MPASSANFAAFRAALVAVVRVACGLGQNQVVMQNSNDPVAQRPVRPFAAIRINTPAIAKGRGFAQHSGLSGDDVGKFDYYQQMAMGVSFDFFADSQDDAYALAGNLQLGMEIEPIYDILSEAGLAVWTVGQVQDLTALLQTGYEARAHLTVQLGYMAHRQIDAGVIEHVPVHGDIVDGKQLTSIDVEADL